MSDSLYELLEVSPNARLAVIKAAYRCLVQQHHPDKIDDLDTSKRMSVINHAYSVLRNPVLRARYDREIKLNQSASTIERRGGPDASNQARTNGFQNKPDLRLFAFRPFK